MTIDDELLLELLKPESDGKVGSNALIRKIVNLDNISFKLEESSSVSKQIGSGKQVQIESVNMTPDILIMSRKGKGAYAYTVGNGLIAGVDNDEYIAFELENDIQWDFQSSLKQVKKYKHKFEDVRIIIPEDYKRFAPLYNNEGIKTYLWQAKRKWQCLRCGKEIQKEGPVSPRCDGCNNGSAEFRLIGVTDCTIKEA